MSGPPTDATARGSRSSRVHLFSIWAAASMLVLVMSGAALTSSRDHSRWPGLLTIHVAIAIASALLIIGLAISFSRFGWIVFFAVLVEIVLGYPLRATGPVVGTLHAVLGAFLVASLAAIALVNFTVNTTPGFCIKLGHTAGAP